MSTALEQIKAWSAPLLVAVILVLAGFIWNGQQERINSLETAANVTSNTLAGISENQKNSLADRTDFQNQTTITLNKMADTLQSLGVSVAKLTAIQDEQRPRIQQQRVPI